MKEISATPKLIRVWSLPLLLKLEGGAGSQTPAAWEPPPRNSVRHVETVTWQLRVVNVLDRFGGFWRWVSLDLSGKLWTTVVRQRFYVLFALVGENRKSAS